MKRFWMNNKGIIVGLFLLLFFRSAIADWYHVPSGSMLPNIMIGDRVWVNKLAYDAKLPFTDINFNRHDEPLTGDVIVFQSVAANERLIKRVIGVPGDIVEMVNNQLTINGKLIQFDALADGQPFDRQLHDRNEADYFLEKHQNQLAYAYDGEGTSLNKEFSVRFYRNKNLYHSSFEPVKVEPDHFWVMGDNRDNSADSRVIGLVPRAEIVGRAERVIISFNPDDYYLPREGRYLEKL